VHLARKAECPFHTEQPTLSQGAGLARHVRQTLSEKLRRYYRTAEIESAISGRRKIIEDIKGWTGPGAQEIALIEHRIRRGPDLARLPPPRRLQDQSSLPMSWSLRWLVVKAKVGERRKLLAMKELYAILIGYSSEAQRQIDRMESRLERRVRWRACHEKYRAEKHGERVQELASKKARRDIGVHHWLRDSG